MQLRVSGMHTPSRKLANGTWRAYAYAWRGGPQIAIATGPTREAALTALSVETSKPQMLAKLSAALEAKDQTARPSINYISGLVLRYLESPEYANKEKRTRADYLKHLNLFRDEFGTWRTALFEDPRLAQDLTDWRDGFNSPRQGDMQMQVISILFSWARSRGLTQAKPTEAISKIYSADRSDLIWSNEQLASVLKHSPGPLSWAIRLAVETGLRQGDLLTLPWSAVSDVAIQVKTNKRGKHVIIPITPAIRETLEAIPRVSPTILTSSTGRPWNDSGLRSSFHRAKARAGITDRTWHDFRGTAVTRLYGTGLTLRDLARIFAWSENRIEAILSRYVSADAVAIDMLNRISQEH